MHRLAAPEDERAQGTPDAGRTRRALRAKEMHFAHAGNNRAAETTGVPCAMVLRLIRDLLGVPGLLAAVACRLVTRRLDPSVGGSGPHDFAVRQDVFVHATRALNTLPATASHPQRP